MCLSWKYVGHKRRLNFERVAMKRDPTILLFTKLETLIFSKGRLH